MIILSVLFHIDSWDQSALHNDDIIQGSCDALQGGYYYIPTYYHSPYTHSSLNIDAPEFVPSWRYSGLIFYLHFNFIIIVFAIVYCVINSI